MAQVSELLDAFRAGLTWRPLNPADQVTLWLDRDTAVPRRIEVSASTDRDRATWAARQDLVEPSAGPIFVIELSDLVINGADPQIPAPPPSTDSRDLGFVDRSVADAELPEPSWLPQGLTPYRSGERRTDGGAGVVVERTWTNGRSWLKVSGTRQWTGNRLFGDLGPLVRPLTDDAAGGPLYRSESGTAVALHGDGIDLLVTGSVGEDDLVRVAGSLGVTALVVPADWPEAGARSLDDGGSGALADELPPGRSSDLPIDPILAPAPGGPSEQALLDRDGTVEISVVGPGATGVRIVQSAGDVLAPVEDPDAASRHRPGHDRPVQPHPRRAHLDRAGPRHRHVEPHGDGRRPDRPGRRHAVVDVRRRGWWALLAVVGVIIGVLAATVLDDAGRTGSAPGASEATPPSGPTSPSVDPVAVGATCARRGS